MYQIVVLNIKLSKQINIYQISQGNYIYRQPLTLTHNYR